MATGQPENVFEERVFIYHLMGKNYGWTPREVDETPYEIIRALLVVLNEEKRLMELSTR